jgi:DNA-binding NarL/FixJ family response regulator
MPVMDGVAASGAIRSRWPEVSVIMLTTFEDDEYVSEALRRGAHGYLLKNIAPRMLVSAIRAVRDGSLLIAPDLAGHLAAALSAAGGGEGRETASLSGDSPPRLYYDSRRGQTISVTCSANDQKRR